MLLIACIAPLATAAQITLLHEFGGQDGAYPHQGLRFDGTSLYGVTLNGGTGIYGTVYTIRPDGTAFNVLHNFNGSNGWEPRGLALAGSQLIGTTRLGGSGGRGNVFAINTNGTGFAQLHTFAGGVGTPGPWAPPTVSAGRVYGSTVAGDAPSPDGTVFAMDTSGANYATLHQFQGPGVGDGRGPAAELTLIGSRLYGTTGKGGTGGAGTFFGVNTDGTGYQVLHSFAAGDRANPQSKLVSDGTRLYGTTIGDPGFGTVYSIMPDGSGYQVLHTFASIDGSDPIGDLFLSGGTLYGTAWQGGDHSGGCVFSISTTGLDFGVLHSFQGGPNDGLQPEGGVIVIGNQLYGTTIGGGDFGSGTVYTFTIPAPSSGVVFAGVFICALRRRR